MPSGPMPGDVTPDDAGLASWLTASRLATLFLVILWLSKRILFAKLCLENMPGNEIAPSEATLYLEMRNLT